jgi:hypothetical protein
MVPLKQGPRSFPRLAVQGRGIIQGSTLHVANGGRGAGRAMSSLISSPSTIRPIRPPDSRERDSTEDASVASPGRVDFVVVSFGWGLAAHPIDHTIQMYILFTTNVNTR